MKVTIASTVFSRLRGLFGRRGFQDALLLTPCNDIHTFGMPEPIDVAFLSSDGRVIASYRAVGTRRRLRCRNAAATLERFARDGPWYERGDRIELKRHVHENLESLDAKQVPTCRYGADRFSRLAQKLPFGQQDGGNHEEMSSM